MKTGTRGFKPVCFDVILRGLAIAVAGSAALAAFGEYDWKLDLFSHWRFHYILAAVILLPFLVFRRHHGFALLALATALMNTMHLRSAPVSAAAVGPTPAIGSSHHVRLVHFNVLFSNPAYGRTVDWLREVGPDVVVLVEITDGWSAAMNALQSELPYRVEVPREDGSGVGVYSRYPIRDSTPYRIGSPPKAALRATLKVNDDEVAVIAAHPWPPTSSHKARERDRYLASILSVIGEINGRLIVSGDLNTTPWSHVFRDFVNASGLTERESLPSWPAMFGLLGIPIDHVLGKGVRIDRVNTGPGLGSDHLPLVAEISF